MDVKIYFSKFYGLPCVESGDEIYVAKKIKIQVPIKGKWFDEQPSWALVGKAKEIEHRNDTIIIT